MSVPQAGKKAETEAALFFPHHPGDTWRMDATSDGQPYGFTLTALGEKKIGGKSASFIQMKRDGAVVQSEGYRLDADGLYWVAFGPDGAGRIEPPLPVLKTPLQSGSRWTWKGAHKSAEGSLPGEAACSLSGPQTVMTPAGSFQAYRVDQKITLTSPDGRYTTTNVLWYAPGVGLVKQTTDDGEQKTSAELTDYKVVPDGKEDADGSKKRQ